jgi:hypothetical protein
MSTYWWTRTGKFAMCFHFAMDFTDMVRGKGLGHWAVAL